MSPNSSSEPAGCDLNTEIALFRYGLIAALIHDPPGPGPSTELSTSSKSDACARSLPRPTPSPPPRAPASA